MRSPCSGSWLRWLPCWLLAACAAAPDVAPVASSPFVVMSCNVRYGTAADGPDAWAERRDALAALLTGQAPAILGVQEALSFQVDFLDQRFPQHQRIGVGRDGGDTGEFSALFVDARRFEVLDTGTFWLSETPDLVGSVGWDAALTRICTWAHLRERPSGRELCVFNTHFDHRGEEARLEAARLIAARVLPLDVPCLVLGDCNAGERSLPLAALRAAGLVDTFRVAHPDEPEVGTFHGFHGGKVGEKIDYVLASAGITTLDASILAEPAANGRFVSDHHPVVATVQLEAPTVAHPDGGPDQR